MLPNSWTTGAKLVIFNEIMKFSGPKDASFFQTTGCFLAIFRNFLRKNFGDSQTIPIFAVPK